METTSVGCVGNGPSLWRHGSLDALAERVTGGAWVRRVAWRRGRRRTVRRGCGARPTWTRGAGAASDVRTRERLPLYKRVVSDTRVTVQYATSTGRPHAPAAGRGASVWCLRFRLSVRQGAQAGARSRVSRARASVCVSRDATQRLSRGVRPSGACAVHVSQRQSVPVRCV